MKTNRMEQEEQLVFGFFEKEEAPKGELSLDETLSMLADLLEEDEWREFDRESCSFVSDQMIYDISTESQISERLNQEEKMLNEGIPSTENIDELELWAQACMATPVLYPIKDDEEPAYLTGFVQMYSGERFDQFGRLIPIWKSLKIKLTISVSDLLVPETIIKAIEKQGFQWTNLLRVIFYGTPLVEITGSKVYLKKESRELTPISEEFPNILVATPDYEDTEAKENSIYDSIKEEYEEASFYGYLPELNRVASGHYELTAARLQELLEEELEGHGFKTITDSKGYTVDQRDKTINTFYQARKFIKSLNENPKHAIEQIHTLDTKTLEDVLYLCSKSLSNINDPLVYAQVRACGKRVKALGFKRTHACALSLIGRINIGERPEIAGLTLASLEKVFEVLWSDVGIRINSEHKEVYFALKERLRALRSKTNGSKS